MQLTESERELVQWLQSIRCQAPIEYEENGETLQYHEPPEVRASRLREECSRLGLDYQETLDILKGYGLLEDGTPSEIHGRDYVLYHITERVTIAARESEAPAATDKAEPRVALAPNEEAVLRKLVSDSSRLLDLVVLEADTKLSRKTVGNIVNKLILKDLADRPNGEREGATCTDKGIELIRTLDGGNKALFPSP